MAIACAPPTAYTSSTPRSAHAARIVGCGRPPWSFCGDEVSAIEPTPATWAGTTFMTTLETRGATPPGTYSPTRPTGTIRCVTVASPYLVTASVSRSASQEARSRRIDSSSAARTSGSSAASASVSASRGTVMSSRTTPS